MIRLGITRGDVKGIGPEIAAAAVQACAHRADVSLQLYGERIADPAHLSDREAGLLSAAAVRTAVDDALAGRLDAIVTAPINKQRWAAAGIAACGHTEYLAQLVHAESPPSVTPLFCSPRWRVAIVTSHIPLSAVAAAVTPAQLTRTMTDTVHALQTMFHIANPRLAVLGLNPHAGEGGLLGKEEEEVIIPTLENLRKQGMVLQGPYPADTFFTGDRRPATGDGFDVCDAIIAMYHDQGLIPIKTLDPWETVQVSTGLPFVRTSPAHGTAEDIVGTGRANPRGMIAAVEFALRLCHCEKIAALRSQ